MRVTKSQLQKIIQEELNAVLKLRQEHRGKSCDEKTGQEKLDCEKQSKEAIEHSQREHQKQRDYGLEDEEIKALSKGKPHHMKPPLRTRKNQITSRADGKGMNRFHNAKGEFSSKTDSASQSVRGASNKPCKHDGQTKMNPRAWTKLPCGRKDRRNPNSKAKHRCKDGSVVNEFLIENGFVNDSSEIVDAGEWLLIRQDYLDTFTIDLMLATLEEFKEELQVETEALMSESNDNLVSKCNQIGMRTFPHFVESFNRLMLASKGELHKQEKK